MNRRAAGWLAWSLWGLSVVLAVLGTGLVVALPPRAFWAQFGVPWPLMFVPLSLALAYSTAGAVVASRFPRNAVGWLLSGLGLVAALNTFAHPYATAGLFVVPFRGGLPAAHVMAWIYHWAPFLFVVLTPLLLMLYPDGRLPSARWRPLAWLTIGAGAALTIARAFGEGMIYLYWEPGYIVRNPFVLPVVARGVSAVSPEPIDLLGPRLSRLMFALVLAGSSVAAVRLRSARGDERQQLKWFTFAGSVILAGFVVLLANASRANDLAGIRGARWDVGMVVMLLGSLGLPIAIAIAILKYRLYDIDVVINRTLVYGALTLCLAATYFAGVLVFQGLLSPLTQGSQLSVAGSTLVVAGVFQPARQWIQTQVDRRFYRRKYDAQKTLDAFGARLQHEMDLETLRTDLREVVRETVRPAHVSLWLRRPTRGS